MSENSIKPVYTRSRLEAKEAGEIPLWRESYQENCRCAEAVDRAVRESFDGMYLKHDCCEAVMEEFGAERVLLVLANTLRIKSYDGRFSRSNLAWAEDFPVYPEDHTSSDFVLRSHPAVLDGFVGLAREYAEEHMTEEQNDGILPQ